MPTKRQTASVTELLVEDTVRRWEHLLKSFLDGDSFDPRYTYRAVAGPEGLFGDYVGAIAQDQEAKLALLKALRREDRLHLVRGIDAFVTLAACDLATRVIDDSMYDGLAAALGQPTLFESATGGSTAKARLQRALASSGVFDVTQNVDGDREFILSLRRFVPAYPMSDEHLREQVLNLLPRFVPKWLARERAFDLDAFRREVFTHLDVSASKRKEMLEPFCDLLLQLRSVVLYAARLDSFDGMSPEQFAARYRHAHGSPPLAGQCLELVAVWGELRALLGVANGTLRSSVQGLITHLRLHEVVSGPNGEPPPRDLLQRSSHDVPWGYYLLNNGMRLLVSNELARFDHAVHDRLLSSQPPETGGLLLDLGKSLWVVTTWPFSLDGSGGGGFASPLLDRRTGRFVRRVSRREFYALYGTGAFHRHFLLLDGSGGGAGRPRTEAYTVWRLLETPQGPRPCAMVVLPPDEKSGPVKILRGDEVLEELAWGSGYTPPLRGVAPDANLRLVWTTWERNVRLRYPDYALFVPGGRPGEWEPLPPHSELSGFGRKVFVTGPVGTQWTGQGVKFSEPRELGPSWNEYRLWEVTREGRSRFVRIGTTARPLWEWERAAHAELNVVGAEVEAGGVTYRDPGALEIAVRGDLGSAAAVASSDGEADADRQVLLHLREDVDRHIVLPVTLDGAAIAASIPLTTILERLGPPRGFARRFSVELEVPSGVWVTSESVVTFFETPAIQLLQRPVVRPGQRVLSLAFRATSLPPGVLEYGDEPTGHWVPATAGADGERCEIEVPVTQDLLRNRRVRVPLRVWGRTFPDGIMSTVDVTGLSLAPATTTDPARGLIAADERFKGRVAGDEGVLLTAVGFAATDELEASEEASTVGAVHLDARTPIARLDADRLHRRETVLLLRFRAGPERTWQSVGTATLTRRSDVTALAARLVAGRVEVTLDAFLPLDDDLEVVLRGRDGDEVDERIVYGDGERVSRSLALQLPLDEDSNGATVLARSRRGSVLARAAVDLAAIDAVDTHASDAHAFYLAVRAARSGETVAGGTPLSNALKRFTSNGDNDPAVGASYVDELLVASADELLRAGVHQELSRVIATMRRAGQLRWWQDEDVRRRALRLLSWAAVSTERWDDRACRRATALAALIAVARNPQTRAVDAELHDQAMQLLAQPKVLGALESADDVLRDVRPADLLSAIEQQAANFTSCEWEYLCRFFRSLDGEQAAAIGVALDDRSSGDAPPPVPLSMLAVLLALSRPGERNVSHTLLSGAMTSIADARQFLTAHVGEQMVGDALGTLRKLDPASRTPAESFQDWARGCRYDLWGGSNVPDALREAGKDYLLAEHELRAERVGAYLSGAMNHLRGGRMPPPWSDLADVLCPLVMLRAGKVEEFLMVSASRQRRPAATAGAWAHLDGVVDLLTSEVLPGPLAATGRGLAGVSPRDDDRLLAAALTGGMDELIAAASTCWVAAWLGWRWTVRSAAALGSGDEGELLYDLLHEALERIPFPDPRLVAEIETQHVGVWHG